MQSDRKSVEQKSRYESICDDRESPTAIPDDKTLQLLGQINCEKDGCGVQNLRVYLENGRNHLGCWKWDWGQYGEQYTETKYEIWFPGILNLSPVL